MLYWWQEIWYMILLLKTNNFAHVKYILVFNNKKHIMLYRMWYWIFEVRFYESGYTVHHAEWFLSTMLCNFMLYYWKWFYSVLLEVFATSCLLFVVDFRELLCLKAAQQKVETCLQNIKNSMATYYCINNQCNR